MGRGVKKRGQKRLRPKSMLASQVNHSKVQCNTSTYVHVLILISVILVRTCTNTNKCNTSTYMY